MEDLLNQIAEMFQGIEPFLSALSKIAAAPLFVWAANALLGKQTASLQDLRDVQELGEKKWGQDGECRAISEESMVSQQNLICLRMHALPLLSTSWMRRSGGIETDEAKDGGSFWPWISGACVLTVLFVGWVLREGSIGGLLSALLFLVFLVCLIYQCIIISRCKVNHKAIAASLFITSALLVCFTLLFLLLISGDPNVKSFDENGIELQIIVSGAFSILTLLTWMFLSRKVAETAVMSKFDGYSALFEDKFDKAVGEYSDIRNTLYLLPFLLLETLVFWCFF